MQAHFKQLEPSLEELCEVGNFVIDDLLVVDVVVGLEVDARVSHEQDALDLDQGKDLFDVELMLELGQFTDVFQAALVEFDLLIAHDAA